MKPEVVIGASCLAKLIGVRDLLRTGIFLFLGALGIGVGSGIGDSSVVTVVVVHCEQFSSEN